MYKKEKNGNFETVEDMFSYMKKGENKMSNDFEECAYCGKKLEMNKNGDTDSVYLELDSLNVEYMKEFCSVECFRSWVKDNKALISGLDDSDIFILFSSGKRSELFKLFE